MKKKEDTNTVMQFDISEEYNIIVKNTHHYIFEVASGIFGIQPALPAPYFLYTWDLINK